MSTKLVTIKSQVSPVEREALRDIAEQEARSVSQVLRIAVRDLLEKYGNGAGGRRIKS